MWHGYLSRHSCTKLKYLLVLVKSPSLLRSQSKYADFSCSSVSKALRKGLVVAIRNHSPVTNSLTAEILLTKRDIIMPTVGQCCQHIYITYTVRTLGLGPVHSTLVRLYICYLDMLVSPAIFLNSEKVSWAHFQFSHTVTVIFLHLTTCSETKAINFTKDDDSHRNRDLIRPALFTQYRTSQKHTHTHTFIVIVNFDHLLTRKPKCIHM